MSANLFSVRRYLGSNRFRRSLAVSLLILTAGAASAWPQGTARTDKEKESYRTAMEGADLKIAAEVQAHSELMKNLEYLTTQIGPRLTGTPQMQQASQWTLERFRAYGLDAHLETTEIAFAWYRGVDTAEIVDPISRRIEVRSAGWSKATAGAVSGQVIFADAKNMAEFETQKGRLKGSFVLLKLFDPPAELGPPAGNAYDSVIPAPRGVPKEGAASETAIFRNLLQIGKAATEGGAAAILFDSGKPDNLFNMTGFGNGYTPSDLPIGFLTHEDFELIRRLSTSGSVTLKIALNGTFSPGPVPASITVAEIKGSELPDERVILGAHLDSWDLGQGALDNGTGTMAVLEAARALHSLGWKPRRTLIFILFTGEETGGTGSKLYLKNHEKEVPKMDAALTHDTGTGRVFSVALDDLYETAPLMEEIYRPLQEVFDLEPLSTRNFGGSDHVIFNRAGVPGYLCVQEPAHYGNAHHSQADTFDKVLPDEINQGAALLAAWAWNVSEMPVPLPHHAPEPPVQNSAK